jgi:hypothetical protein
MSRTMGYLQVFSCKEPDGRVVGGAGFLTWRETRARFDAVPATDEPTDYVLDLMDRHGDILDDKLISWDTAAHLLGIDA